MPRCQHSGRFEKRDLCTSRRVIMHTDVPQTSSVRFSRHNVVLGDWHVRDGQRVTAVSSLVPSSRPMPFIELT